MIPGGKELRFCEPTRRQPLPTGGVRTRRPLRWGDGNAGQPGGGVPFSPRPPLSVDAAEPRGGWQCAGQAFAGLGGPKSPRDDEGVGGAQDRRRAEATRNRTSFLPRPRLEVGGKPSREGRPWAVVLAAL